MKIVFITYEQYPNGGAAANRHIALMEALSSLCEVELLILGNNTNYIYANSNFKVTYINFKYKRGIYLVFKSIINLLFLKKYIKKGTTSIFYLGTSGLILLPIIAISNKYNIQLMHERTELPSLNIKSVFSKLDYYVYRNFLMHRFNIIFVISKALKKELSLFPKMNKDQIHILNMVVDFERFKNLKNNSFNYSIAYCGSMRDNKDGLKILVESFKKVLDIFPLSKLTIIGDNNTRYFKENIEPIINHNMLNENIILAGLVSRNEVPNLLALSNLLVLSREDDVQAKYGFPTKLGEYLATSIPTIVTSVGDIPIFFKDKHDIYLSKPNCPVSFADKIIYVFNHYDAALTVGKNGFDIAEKNFSSKIESQKIFKFMKL